VKAKSKITPEMKIEKENKDLEEALYS